MWFYVCKCWKVIGYMLHTNVECYLSIFAIIIVIQRFTSCTMACTNVQTIMNHRMPVITYFQNILRIVTHNKCIIDILVVIHNNRQSVTARVSTNGAFDCNALHTFQIYQHVRRVRQFKGEVFVFVQAHKLQAVENIMTIGRLFAE